MSKEFFVVKGRKLGRHPEEIGIAGKFETAGMTPQAIEYRAKGLAIVALLCVHPGCENKFGDNNVNVEIIHRESNALTEGIHQVVFNARSICMRSFGRKVEINHGSQAITVDGNVSTAEDLYRVATAECMRETEAAFPGKPSTLIIDDYQHFVHLAADMAVAS